MSRAIKMILLGIILVGINDCANNETQSIETLTYSKTVYGGCNENSEGAILSKAVYENDTLYWEISDDTLKIFTGIQYICCAPFFVESYQNGDSVTVMIEDTCRTPYDSCYCRCICYYEFLTMFTGYDDDRYHLLVYLHDPRQTQDSLLWCVEIP